MKFALLAAIAAGPALAADTAQPGAPTPRPTPPMVFKRGNGGTIDPRQYRGKVVALEFLLTTCPHCQKCSQTLQKLQDEFGARGFQALGVAYNDSAQNLVADYAKEFGIRFPLGHADRSEVYRFFEVPTNEVLYAPRLALIDRRGVIRFQQVGYGEGEEAKLRAQVAELLKGTPATAARKSPAPSPIKR